jgi:hypothetical protein
VDFEEIFAHVAHLEAMRLLMALVVEGGLAGAPYGHEDGVLEWRVPIGGICATTPGFIQPG